MTQMRLMNYALQGTYKEDVQNDITNQQILIKRVNFIYSRRLITQVLWCVTFYVLGSLVKILIIVFGLIYKAINYSF